MLIICAIIIEVVSNINPKNPSQLSAGRDFFVLILD